MQHRVVLVTGASSGIGALCAARLARAGCRVLAASRRGTAPPGCTGLVMDVDDDASVAVAVSAALAREGRIDAAVLCAGWGHAGALEDTPTAELAAQFQTNLFGAHRVCRVLLPAMRLRGAGTLVLVSSIMAELPVPYQGPYSASKAALSSYAEALRLEMRPFGVQVIAVEPGNFRTGFTGARRRAAGWTGASAHAARAEASLAWMEADERKAPPPELVAARIERLLAMDRPPGRVVIAASLVERAAPALRRLLPARLYEALALRLYRVL